MKLNPILLIFWSLFFITPSLSARASDSPAWYCKEVASERKGSQVYACGVGLGADENEARTDAFENARKEFIRICSLSADCKDHQIITTPERTTCETSGKKTKCYRLLVFSIGPKGGDPLPALEKSKNSGPSLEARAEATKPEPIEEIKDTSVKEIFRPFVYSQIKNNPKVYKGMPKAVLLRQFGAPKSISELSYKNDSYFFWYEGLMCNGPTCHVIVTNDEVERFADFKPIFTDVLR